MMTLWRNTEGGTKLGVQERCRYSTWSNFETINILFKFKSSAKRIISSHRHPLLFFTKHIRANVSSSKGSFLYYIMLNLKGLHLWKIKNPLLCRAVAKEIHVANYFCYCVFLKSFFWVSTKQYFLKTVRFSSISNIMMKIQGCLKIYLNILTLILLTCSSVWNAYIIIFESVMSPLQFISNMHFMLFLYQDY